MADTSPKGNLKGCLTIFGSIFLISVAFTALLTLPMCSGKEGTLTPEQKVEADKKRLSEWYEKVSPYSCEKELKKTLRNPRSYERDGDFTTLADLGEDKTILWKFRAENGFGGLDISTAWCDISKRNGGELKVKSR